MKITQLHVDGFGVWKDLDLEAAQGGLTVIFGPNEAGKTTLLEFMRSVLYGFAPVRRGKYLPPAFGGTPGGRLHVESAQGPVRIARHWNDAWNNGRGGEELSLATRDGRALENTQLSSLLGGVNERVFENVFAVGLAELQELATLQDTEAARQLYELAGGFDRVSLGSVNRGVMAERNKLLGNSPSEGALPKLLAERAKLQEKVAALEASGRQWAGLQASRHDLDAQIDQLERELAAQRHDARLYQAADEVRGLWQQKLSLEEQLDLLGPLSESAARAAERLGGIRRRRLLMKRQYRKLKKQAASIKRDAAELAASDLLLRNAPRIEALYEQRDWIASLDEQCDRLEAELVEFDRKIEQQVAAAGLMGNSPVEITPQIISQLKPTATAIQQQRTIIRESEEALSAAREKSSVHQQQLSSALGGKGGLTLLGKIEQQGEAVSRLRRCIEINDRLEQLDRQQKELDAESESLHSRQVLPGPTLAALGTAFAVGVMLLLAALLGGWLFGFAGVTRFFLAVLGIGGIGGAIGTKLYLERTNRLKLEETEYQLDTLEAQAKKLNEEKKELGKAITSGGGPLDTQLQTAQRELDRLEALLPHSAELETASAGVRDAESRGENAREALNRAMQGWRNKLARLGLPPGLSPKELRDLATQSRGAAALRRQREEKAAELNQRRRELSSSANRIDQILSDLRLTPLAVSPLARLEQINGELRGVAGDIARREQLRGRHERTSRKMRKCRRTYHKLGRRREELLHEAGASDETQIERLTEKLNRAAELRERRDMLKQQILSLTGGEVTEASLAEILGGDVRDVHGRLRTATGRLEQAEARHRRLVERRGELKGQLKGLLDPAALASARLDLACLETKLANAKRHWQTLAVCGHGLARVQKQIEQTRQPAVLAEASRYFEKLTFGEYSRIWTPWDEDTLKVDGIDGKTLGMESLSQGTREQVFLSLRLALAAWYARRGTPLPVVLDDVLVNFDQRRAAATARVLLDYASGGQQVFVFTCHEHIMEMFESMQVGVITLPDYRRPGKVRPKLVKPAPELVVAAIAEVPTPVVVEEPVEEEEVVAVVEPVVEEIVEEVPEPVLPEPEPEALDIEEEEEYDEIEIEEPAGETTWELDEDPDTQPSASPIAALAMATLPETVEAEEMIIVEDEEEELAEEDEYEDDELEDSEVEEDEDDESDDYEYEEEDELEEDELEEESDEEVDEDSEYEDEDEEDEFEEDELEEDEAEEEDDLEEEDSEEEYEDDEYEEDEEEDSEYDDEEYEEEEEDSEEDDSDEEEVDEEEDLEEDESDDFEEEEDEEAWDDEHPEAA